jgi:pilus assembly protein Flp/PilA
MIPLRREYGMGGGGEGSAVWGWIVREICGFLEVLRDERGQDLVEYGMLVALIAVICLAAVAFVGGQISTVWSVVSSTLGSAL